MVKTMKYFSLILLALLINFAQVQKSVSQDSFNLFAQNEEQISDDDLLAGFDYEPADEDMGRSSYNVLGLGWNIGAFFNENGNFSEFMQKQFGMGEISMPIFMNGASFKLALEATKNVSFSLQYLAGSKKYEQKLISDDLLGYSRYLKYGTSYFNIGVDYAFVPVKHFAILAGVGFGLSSLNIDFSQTKSEYEFDTEFTNELNDKNTKFYKLDGNFFSVDPHLSLQYVLTSNFIINVTGSYMIPFSPKWDYNNYAEMKNTSKELKPQGFLISLGLSFGIFDF